MEPYEKFVKSLEQFKEDAEFVWKLEKALNDNDIEDEFITRKELAKTFDILLRLIEKWTAIKEDNESH